MKGPFLDAIYNTIVTWNQFNFLYTYVSQTQIFFCFIISQGEVSNLYVYLIYVALLIFRKYLTTAGSSADIIDSICERYWKPQKIRTAKNICELDLVIFIY